jgi:hypothetical protein
LHRAHLAGPTELSGRLSTTLGERALAFDRGSTRILHQMRLPSTDLRSVRLVESADVGSPCSRQAMCPRPPSVQPDYPCAAMPVEGRAVRSWLRRRNWPTSSMPPASGRSETGQACCSPSRDFGTRRKNAMLATTR